MCKKMRLNKLSVSGNATGGHQQIFEVDASLLRAVALCQTAFLDKRPTQHKISS